MTPEALTPERILEATEEVLRRHGPAKATVVDVARVLGVSHGSVYRHFRTKAALREAVTERWLGRTEAALAKITAEKCGWGEYKVVASFPGTKVEHAVFRHPFLDRDSFGLLADYVTLDQGTGAVHTAPGHGQEDYATGRHYGIETYCPVDPSGRFYHATGAAGRLQHDWPGDGRPRAGTGVLLVGRPDQGVRARDLSVARRLHGAGSGRPSSCRTPKSRPLGD